MTYHGLVEWKFGKDEVETHYSSFSIDRDPGTSYAITKIQFVNRFQDAMIEEFGDRVLILNVNIKTVAKVAHLS